MHTTDARRLSPEGQADLRRRVVAAVAGGMSQQEAARVFGISRRAVGVWVRAHRESGPAALESQRRGRSPGDQLALSCAQQVELLADLCRHAPDDLGLAAPLWSRRVLADHIAARFGMPLTTTTVGHYLTRWGLLDPARRGTAGSSVHRSWQVSWHRARPQFLGTSLLPAPGGADVLVGNSPRGAIHFLCLQPPYTLAALEGFTSRLERVEGNPVAVSIGGWPADQTGLLRAWRSAQPGATGRPARAREGVPGPPVSHPHRR